MIELHNIYRIDETRGNIERVLGIPTQIVELIYDAFPRGNVAWVAAKVYAEWARYWGYEFAADSWEDFTKTSHFENMTRFAEHDRSEDIVRLLDTMFKTDTERRSTFQEKIDYVDKIARIRDILGSKMSDAKQIYAISRRDRSSDPDAYNIISFVGIFAAWIRQDPARRPNDMWFNKFIDTYGDRLKDVIYRFQDIGSDQSMDFDEIMEMLFSHDVKERRVADVGDGTYWVELLNRAARDVESSRMVHCGAARGQLFSLRNASDYPHLTVEVIDDRIVQAREYQNEDVGEWAVPALEALIVALDIRGIKASDAVGHVDSGIREPITSRLIAKIDSLSPRKTTW